MCHPSPPRAPFCVGHVTDIFSPCSLAYHHTLPQMKRFRVSLCRIATPQTKFGHDVHNMLNIRIEASSCWNSTEDKNVRLIEVEISLFEMGRHIDKKKRGSERRFNMAEPGAGQQVRNRSKVRQMHDLSKHAPFDLKVHGNVESARKPAGNQQQNIVYEKLHIFNDLAQGPQRQLNRKFHILFQTPTAAADTRKSATTQWSWRQTGVTKNILERSFICLTKTFVFSLLVFDLFCQVLLLPNGLPQHIGLAQQSQATFGFGLFSKLVCLLS